MQKSEYSPVKLAIIEKYISGKKILDLGAGKLLYSTWIREKFSDSSIVAIDMIEQDSLEGVEYFTADLEQKIPLDSLSFSTVLAFDVIEHISNETLFVSEINRLLSVGGVLVGSVPHDKDLFLPEYNLTFYHRSDLTHKRYYTQESLRKTLEVASFSGVEIFAEGGVSPHVFAEFFPKSLRWVVKKMISVALKLRIISTQRLKSDLFFVATKQP